MKKITLLLLLLFAVTAFGQDCDYTLEANDSFGDGWNGAMMDVLVDGVVVLDDVSLDDDPANDGSQGLFTFSVSAGADVTTVFEDGGGFPGEVSYRILDSQGGEAGTGDAVTNIETGTITAACPTCLAPFDIIVASILDVSAELSWLDANDPTTPAFTVEWGLSGFDVGMGTIVTDITETSLMLSGLDPNTAYDFYVTANCAVDDASDVVGPVTFTTSPIMAPPGDCSYTLEMNDSFGDGWNGALMDVFRNGEIVLDNVSLDGDPDNDGTQGIVLFEVLPGDDVTTVFVDGGGFPGEVSYRILDVNLAEVGTGDAVTNIETGTITADCPMCIAPSGLMVMNITDMSADLIWADGNDPATPAFTVEWGPTGFEVGMGTIVADITEASLMLSGLDPDTAYEFYVTANCTVDLASDAVGPVAFTTLPVMAPPGDCSYTLEMNDSFGDGWNGALMDVFRNGEIVLNDVSLDMDPDNDGTQGVLPFEVLPGDDVTTVFVDGGGFPGEVSYRILDSNFAEVATGDVDNNVETGTVTANCPTCFAPFDLVAGNFAPGSVDLTWSMPMAALGYNWEIQDVGVPQGDAGAIASGNTLADTFDTAFGAFVDGNTYTFYIQAGCTPDDFSDFVSIDFLYFLPPANDDCENAIEVICGDTVTGATTNAGDSGGNPGGDVFYTYVTPETAQNVTLSLCDGATDYDSLIRVFDDACDLVNEIAINDDTCGLQSEVTFTATVGNTYTIMVEGFGANVGNFSMAVTCEEALSIDDNALEGFSFYPNPAQDVITLDARTAIEDITMYNVLGQVVLQQKVDGLSNYQLNVSTMAKGMYLMQVTTNGKVGVYRVMKN
jgi:hypothetical protein